MNNVPSVLVIEDDKSISRMLALSLRGQGYGVLVAQTGLEALAAVQSNKHNLILLDLGLPDRDGLDLIAQIKDSSDAPIIVVTARDQESQKISALDLGADDYVTKPFSMPELLARVRAAMRRVKLQADGCAGEYSTQGLSVDREKRKVSLEGVEVHLTPNEYALLLFFIDNRGKALTHRAIQHEVWGYPSSDNHKTLRVLTASLRRKLQDKPSNPRFIKTEVGVGYRFMGE